MIGLLSALKSFSSDFYDTQFEGIELSGYKFYYFESVDLKPLGLSFCAGADPKYNVKNVNKLFKKLEKEYIDHSKNNTQFINNDSIEFIIERLDKLVGMKGRN